MSTDDAGNGGGKTFTQAEVNQIVADRLARERAKYADYDELKAKAGEADKQKSQLDRIEAQLAEQVKRTEVAEREALVREVADVLGVSVRMARKFEGKTRDEMLADGRETLTDMGIEPDKSKRKSSTNGSGNDDDQQEGQQDDAGQDDDAQQQSGNGASRNDGADREPRRSTARRPAEALRSGAPATQPEAPKSPLDLIANVRRL